MYQDISKKLAEIGQDIDNISDIILSGTITRISGFMLEAAGLKVSVGAICKVIITSSKNSLLAEVIGFAKDKTFLMSFEEPLNIIPGTKIYYVAPMLRVPVGKSLLGRIINGLCEPIDRGPSLHLTEYYQLFSKSINPIDRKRISTPIDVGVRAINALLTVGQGQRLGIFAGSGVGKSILLGMITRFTEANIVIVGLIGERGREVKEFIEENVGAQNLGKTVIIAAPVDTSPLERTNGALTATAIAEYFRDQGQNVVLIIDSLTRYAQALRQIYLMLGEMPSSKGYSPSVFSKLSQLVERTGNGGTNQGSITSFYTVLTEGDDLSDPVADHVRSILDGHIILSRKLADRGHYPAIDIGASISRVMTSIVSKEQLNQVHRFKRLYSAYQENHDLIKMGMYQIGADSLVDQAVNNYDKMVHFLQQEMNEKSVFADNITELMNLLT